MVENHVVTQKNDQARYRPAVRRGRERRGRHPDRGLRRRFKLAGQHNLRGRHRERQRERKRVNLVPYGADKYKSDFASWAWAQVGQGSGIYAMPSDFGPMGFYYDTATLARYHVIPPATWAQFATDAVKLHSENPKAYLANFPANDPQWLMDMMAQAGAWPYKYTGGSNITIDWTGPVREKFASFWQTLISSRAVDAGR